MQVFNYPPPSPPKHGYQRSEHGILKGQVGAKSEEMQL